MRRSLALALLLSSSCSAGLIDLKGKPIDEYTFAIEGRLWLNTLRGHIEASESGFFSTRLDFEDDLEIENEEWSFEGAAELRLKRFVIRASYFETTFQDSDTVSRSFTFDDTTFTVSERIDSEFEFRLLAGDLQFLIVDAGSAAELGFEIALGVGLRYIWAVGEIESETTGLREREDGDLPVPVGSVSASLGIANVVRIEAQLAGIGIRLGRYHVAFLEGQLSARVYIYRYVYAGLGWRHVFAELERDRGSEEFDVEASISGPFFAVGCQF